MTSKWLGDEISPLSSAQLNFRTAPDRWTIAEVLQHLVLGEPIYWKLFQDGMKQPTAKLDHGSSDADVLWYGIDRSHHQRTQASENPKSTAVDPSKALASFRTLHAVMLGYARTTQEDLRAHSVPEWQVDAYQCLLEISTHRQRHILQIREIKSDPAFPRQ